VKRTTNGNDALQTCNFKVRERCVGRSPLSVPENAHLSRKSGVAR
jgi:hypothetical protein